MGVHNVEIWSPHFDRLSNNYASGLRRAAEAAGSVITNVRLDGVKYNLSDPSSDERSKSVNLVKLWMERGALAAPGSPGANDRVVIGFIGTGGRAPSDGGDAR